MIEGSTVHHHQRLIDNLVNRISDCNRQARTEGHNCPDSLIQLVLNKLESNQL